MQRTIDSYRPDIDGLRALAVIAVIVFHAFPQHLPGGFVGVDVFFVISGYLISSILIKDVALHQFSIFEFYIRRARRLFPALLTVLFGSISLGFFLLLPDEWHALGKHISSGAIFVSNFTLMREVGYFDGAAEQKPLLHLWSLAVEEQFYLFWPLLLAFTIRRSVNTLFAATVAVILVSLVASIYLTDHDASLAFFAPITRFWELLIGSSLAIWQRYPHSGSVNVWRHLASAAGLGCIFFSIFSFKSDMDFPGYVAALPCIGAALIIWAGHNSFVNKLLLSSKWLVSIGLISYPLYLWHWPSLVFYRLLTPIQTQAPYGELAAISFSLLLSWLTYRLIESPCRRAANPQEAKRIAGVLWFVLLGLGLFGLGASSGNIAANSERSQTALAISQAATDWEYIDNRVWPGRKPGTVLFVGDSHMQQYAPRIDELMLARGSHAKSARLIAKSGCTPIPNIERKSINCAEFTSNAFAAMNQPEVTTIVIAASWVGFSTRLDYYKSDDPTRRQIAPMTDSSTWLLERWGEELRKLVNSGKRVVVVLGSPRGTLVDPKQLVQRGTWVLAPSAAILQDRDKLGAPTSDTNTRIARVARASGATIIDPFDDFCDESKCKVSSPDGVPFFKDESHIRASYVRTNIHFLDKYLIEE